MDDRTTCCLYISVEQQKRFEQLCKDNPIWDISDWAEVSEISNVNPELDEERGYTYQDVNYANLEDLEELVKAGIPFEFYWEAGSEYSEGHRLFYILPDGSSFDETFNREDFYISLNDIKKHRNNYEELADYVRLRLKKIEVPNTRLSNEGVSKYQILNIVKGDQQ